MARRWTTGKILPRLAEVPPAVIATATGLSLAYCRRVRRGLVTPHPMWWEALSKVTQEV